MTWPDFLGNAAIVGACTTILGWWLKSRLDSSIRHEYDKILESFKAELKRSDVLLTERLAAFKTMSSHLLALRRYCNECADYFRYFISHSEFAPVSRPTESGSLLGHHTTIRDVLEGSELFISANSREGFERLFAQMAMGFNLELLVASSEHDPAFSSIFSSAPDLYDSVASRVNDVLGDLYSDLGLPQNLVQAK
jgi:hypothetical protein